MRSSLIFIWLLAVAVQGFGLWILAHYGSLAAVLFLPLVGASWFVSFAVTTEALLDRAMARRNNS